MNTNKYVGIFFTLIHCISCSSGGGGSGVAKNCDDFRTQPEAQEYYVAHNATNLDRDNDGIACESLPNSERVREIVDMTEYVGEYVLLGDYCDQTSCYAKTAQLIVLQDDVLSICVRDWPEHSCDETDFRNFSTIAMDEYVFSFSSGDVMYGSRESGHVSLHYNQVRYYGQNIKNTDFLKDGLYFDSGVKEIGPESFSLSSTTGRDVKWDRLRGIIVESD